MISPRWRRRLFVVLLVSVAYVLGSSAQEQLGISFSVEGLEGFREWVQGLGWWGPAVYILLVIFRLFIGLSSHLVLILGGLAFGAGVASSGERGNRLTTGRTESRGYTAAP